eukprot:NODE_7715_length_748_cov_39.721600_g7101_i0.p1 GENE.NODE_7715_length_748_cov_39.721600_g7101_i0~~NODE_7715_length_748_cov_39.721600_g7101_i0.p1  ORF type:complete len:231 (+),score=45.71 NODE_7715_length_748_cov_39.721600_g7101_i0:63-695(+)
MFRSSHVRFWVNATFIESKKLHESIMPLWASEMASVNNRYIYPLHAAAAMGTLEDLRDGSLLVKKKALVTPITDEYNNAVYVPLTIRHLIQSTRESILDYCIQRGSAEMVDYVIHLGCSPTVTSLWLAERCLAKSEDPNYITKCKKLKIQVPTVEEARTIDNIIKKVFPVMKEKDDNYWSEYKKQLKADKGKYFKLVQLRKPEIYRPPVM